MPAGIQTQKNPAGIVPAGQKRQKEIVPADAGPNRLSVINQIFHTTIIQQKNKKCNYFLKNFLKKLKKR